MSEFAFAFLCVRVCVSVCCMCLCERARTCVWRTVGIGAYPRRGCDTFSTLIEFDCTICMLRSSHSTPHFLPTNPMPAILSAFHACTWMAFPLCLLHHSMILFSCQSAKQIHKHKTMLFLVADMRGSGSKIVIGFGAALMATVGAALVLPKVHLMSSHVIIERPLTFSLSRATLPHSGQLHRC